MKERTIHFCPIFDHFMRMWYYIPAQQELAEKYFKPIEAEVGPLKQVADLEKSISMMFINSHIRTDPPRPKMPNLIDVGGIHIKKNETIARRYSRLPRQRYTRCNLLQFRIIHPRSGYAKRKTE